MISFIIPTLNEEEAIERTLECLARYRGAKEIIVSDGGSKDKTVKLARQFADKILVHQDGSRQTIGGGRNAGAKVAEGDLLAFVDADVFIPDVNDFFAKVKTIFEDDPRILAMTCYYRVWPELATWADRVIFKIVGWLYFFYNNILRVGGSGGELQVIRADAFRRLGGYSEKLPVSEDNELFWRLAKLGSTHFERSLFVLHTNRGHKIGWPRLLWDWTINGLWAVLFKHSYQDEWKPIR